MTSNDHDLRDRIRRRTEAERQKMDAIAERELQTFGETLRGSARHKLHTIETVMETETTRIHGQLRSLRELLWRDLRADLVDRGDHLADSSAARAGGCCGGS